MGLIASMHLASCCTHCTWLLLVRHPLAHQLHLHRAFNPSCNWLVDDKGICVVVICMSLQQARFTTHMRCLSIALQLAKAFLTQKMFSEFAVLECDVLQSSCGDLLSAEFEKTHGAQRFIVLPLRALALTILSWR